jgi:hypothetical protein
MGSDDAAGHEGVAEMEVGDAASALAATDTTELSKVRDLVLQAHPDVVPDLVRGTSLDELLDSVEPARSAYQQVAERVRVSQTAAQPATAVAAPLTPASPPSVPAGGTATVVDPGALSPTTKIARALAARRGR